MDKPSRNSDRRKLSEREERALLDLVGSPGWALAKQFADELVEASTRDAMRRGADQREADFHRGAVDRLRYFFEFVDGRAATCRKEGQ